MTAQHLLTCNRGEDISAEAARLMRSGARMQALHDDMLDFSRTQLGVGIRGSPVPANVGALVDEELDQLRAVHGPERIQRCGEARTSPSRPATHTSIAAEGDAGQSGWECDQVS
jgi:signal transduction histidine kinase